jgi:hypothetical protein
MRGQISTRNPDPVATNTVLSLSALTSPVPTPEGKDTTLHLVSFQFSTSAPASEPVAQMSFAETAETDMQNEGIPRNGIEPSESRFPSPSTPTRAATFNAGASYSPSSPVVQT